MDFRGGIVKKKKKVHGFKALKQPILQRLVCFVTILQIHHSQILSLFNKKPKSYLSLVKLCKINN